MFGQAEAGLIVVAFVTGENITIRQIDMAIKVENTAAAVKKNFIL
jgi:hypothetical protein